MTKRDGPQHRLLGQLLGFRFDHQDAFAGARDDKVELARRHLVECRVEHIGAVDIADPAAGDRPEKRDPRQGQRRRTADQRHDVRVVLQIVAQYRADHLRLVAEPGEEQRPDRPVDEPRGQRLLLRGPSLALEKPAGDLACGKRLFLVVDGERKEILPGLRRFHRDGGA